MKTQSTFGLIGLAQGSSRQIVYIQVPVSAGIFFTVIGKMLSVMRWCCGTCCPLC